MSLLRILRNLAVLVILTVAIMSLTPRTVAAQSSCLPLGAYCHPYGIDHQCCNSWCGYTSRCCKPLHGMTCSSWIQCCSGACINGGCN
jgi:hypothetical protein